MDLFEKKNISPMLIKDKKEPFNSTNYIYELKLDGIRCIAYLDNYETDLRSRKNISLSKKFPELYDIHKQINNRCILDGELIVIKNGVPDFFEVQRRVVLSDPFKISLSYKQLPASFVAFDILYFDRKELMDQPLIVRKNILESCIKETSQLSISRFIHESGIELYKAAEERKLEGVVAKRKDSLYWQDKHTRDWVKFKRMEDEDFVICGFIRKKPMNVLLLGQYENNKLVYKGSVYLGVRLNFLLQQYNPSIINYSPFNQKINESGAINWLDPVLVCNIEYMPNTKDSLRQSVFKGIRDDVLPKECQVNNLNI